MQHSLANNPLESINVVDLPMWVDVVSATRPDLHELLDAVRLIGVAWQNQVSTIDCSNFELRVTTSIEYYELFWTLFIAYATISSQCVAVLGFDGLRELCIDCAIVKSPKLNPSTGKRMFTFVGRSYYLIQRCFIALLNDQSLQELYEKASGSRSSVAEVKGLAFHEAWEPFSVALFVA